MGQTSCLSSSAPPKVPWDAETHQCCALGARAGPPNVAEVSGEGHFKKDKDHLKTRMGSERFSSIMILGPLRCPNGHFQGIVMPF